MGYSPQDNRDLLNSNEERIRKEITICRAVVDMLESDGWAKTAGPLLDRSIIDTIGGKIDDTWVGGKVDRARKEEKQIFYLGYKQALVDFHNRLFFHKQQLKLLEDSIVTLLKEKEDKFRVPMVDDTRYRG